ncbi:hypothetical protein EMIT0P2_130079 [Pseudomonas sp. IT-P2]|jgi:CHAT domain-containing protein
MANKNQSSQLQNGKLVQKNLTNKQEAIQRISTEISNNTHRENLTIIKYEHLQPRQKQTGPRTFIRGPVIYIYKRLQQLATTP